jgi:hypothetical protein
MPGEFLEEYRESGKESRLKGAASEEKDRAAWEVR